MKDHQKCGSNLVSVIYFKIYLQSNWNVGRINSQSVLPQEDKTHVWSLQKIPIFLILLLNYLNSSYLMSRSDIIYREVKYIEREDDNLKIISTEKCWVYYIFSCNNAIQFSAILCFP